MAKHRIRQRIDILIRNIVFAMNQRLNSSRRNQRLSRTRARAHSQIVLGRFACRVALRLRCRHKCHRICQHAVRHRNLLGYCPHPQHFFRRNDRLRHLVIAVLCKQNDGLQLFNRRIPQHQFKHKAIRLRFRQFICAFLFNRILGCQHKERLFQSIVLARNADHVFLHCLQKCALRLRRGSVNLVRQDDIAENRSRMKAKHRISVGILLDDVRTCHIRRHQIRCKLDARKRQPEYAPHRANQARFARSRNTLQQHISARNQRDNDIFHRITLTDDISGKLFKHIVTFFAEMQNLFFRSFHRVLLHESCSVMLLQPIKIRFYNIKHIIRQSFLINLPKHFGII